jgi:hypothetical protein
MQKTNKQIKEELLVETDNSSSYRQKYACFQAICDIVDQDGDTVGFLLSLRDFLLDYIKED